MTEFGVLIHAQKGYVRYIYCMGHQPLDALEDELRESFADIIFDAGDDPKKCQLVGEMKWIWLRFTPSRMAIIKQFDDELGKQDFAPVTMMRVHRVRGKHQ